MVDRSKFTDEEWQERSYRKTVGWIKGIEKREKKLNTRFKEKEAHLKKMDDDIQRVENFKLDKDGNIDILLEDGSIKKHFLGSPEKLKEYQERELEGLQSKKESVQRDHDDKKEERRVLIELKLEDNQKKKEFWKSINFSNQKEKFGYPLRKTKAKFDKTKKDKIYKIDYTRKELEKDWKSVTGKKKVDISFGKKVQEKVNEFG